MKRILIYWTKKSTLDIIRKTKEKYRIKESTTLNFTTECEVDDTVFSAMQKAQELGYVEIRRIEEIE
jgi:hypothetical protein